jgi:hypothetical protein
VVDLMAREGTTFPIFSAYIVTSSWPHRQKEKGLWSIAIPWTSSISSIVKETVYSASLSLSVSLFQIMLDNSPLDSGSMETLPFGAFPNMWLTEEDGAYDAVLPNSTPNNPTASTLFFASTETLWPVVRPVLGAVLVHYPRNKNLLVNNIESPTRGNNNNLLISKISSSLLLLLFTYIDDARSNTNQK